MYNKKRQLIDKIKNTGLLWPYDMASLNDTLPDDVLLEYIMKYGDISDIDFAMKVYNKAILEDVWERLIKYDIRFIKLSVFLARMFFKLDIEANDIKQEINERGFFIRQFNP